MPAVLQDLETALDADDDTTVLSAAWNVFDVVGRVADGVTWAPGSDELQALLAAQACSAGRRLLPPPEAGRPVEVLPGDLEGSLSPYVELLERAQEALSQLADAEGTDAGGRSVLLEAASHAGAGVVCLADVREAR